MSVGLYTLNASSPEDLIVLSIAGITDEPTEHHSEYYKEVCADHAYDEFVACVSRKKGVAVPSTLLPVKSDSPKGAATGGASLCKIPSTGYVEEKWHHAERWKTMEQPPENYDTQRTELACFVLVCRVGGRSRDFAVYLGGGDFVGVAWLGLDGSCLDWHW